MADTQAYLAGIDTDIVEWAGHFIKQRKEVSLAEILEAGINEGWIEDGYRGGMMMSDALEFWVEVGKIKTVAGDHFVWIG